MTLYKCHETDGMASLAYNSAKDALKASGGFRHHIRLFANSIGITGYVQRSRHTDMVILAEGSCDQIEQFNTWLLRCNQQGMFSHRVVKTWIQVSARTEISFRILLDGSRPYHKQDQPDGVVRGMWSDNHNEQLSSHSCNLYRGGASRSSSSSSHKSGSESGSAHAYAQPRVHKTNRLKAAGKQIVGGDEQVH